MTKMGIVVVVTAMRAMVGEVVVVPTMVSALVVMVASMVEVW